MFCRPCHRTLFFVIACARLNAAPQPDSPQTVSQSEHRAPPASQPEYTVTRWSAERGLPQNSIKALLQTHDGYLWVGTLNGLARFDGVRFKVFDHNNTPEMTHDSINELVEDLKDGSLWIGTGAG